MPKKSVCVKASKIHGEKAIILLNKLKIADKELRIQRVNDFIYIPLIHQPSRNELETLKRQVPKCEVATYTFPEEKKRKATLTELLEDKLQPHLLASLPRAIDFVGDIAIIEIPPELESHKVLVGEAILKLHKNVHTVLAKAGAVSGVYRLREFNVIAGKPKTDTVHKEYGCRYHVDLARAYFSPRLSNEHNRVASLVKEGETVVDLFAGVGPFSILIAKTHGNVKVYAVDMNPHAVEFLKKNIRLNRVYGKVYPLSGDAKQIVKQRLCGVADRVIMNLPEKAIKFVDAACEAIKPTGGVVHFYSFVKASDSLENVTQRFMNAVKGSGRNVEKILFSRFVRATAPYEWQAVLDVKIH
ncbi:class I SAM-dependent methyltransferase family protein [Candidatus Bathyarchaeota archaeon]|nr:class I SAM-dependent methyltransferase family protein [Candidatus Bathyarchaeota archaeon]